MRRPGEAALSSAPMLGALHDRRSLRGAALMPAAALAVHQLRYRLAFGARAPHELAAQGHAYLTTAAPCIVLLAALAIGATLGRLAQRWAAGAAASAGRSPRGTGVRVWLLASLALIAIFTAQELLEGLLASGHPGGLAGAFGAGGWWALPLALLAGAVLALALRAERAAERALAAAHAVVRLRAPRAEPLLGSAPPAPSLVAPAPLAREAAGRAPPGAAAASLA
jgi:hypothetical protein